MQPVEAQDRARQQIQVIHIESFAVASRTATVSIVDMVYKNHVSAISQLQGAQVKIGIVVVSGTVVAAGHFKPSPGRPVLGTSPNAAR